MLEMFELNIRGGHYGVQRSSKLMGNITNHHSLESSSSSLLFILPNLGNVIELVDKCPLSSPNDVLCCHIEVLRTIFIQVINSEQRIDLRIKLVSFKLTNLFHMVLESFSNGAVVFMIGLCESHGAVRFI